MVWQIWVPRQSAKIPAISPAVSARLFKGRALGQTLFDEIAIETEKDSFPTRNIDQRQNNGFSRGIAMSSCRDNAMDISKKNILGAILRRFFLRLAIS